MTINDFLQSRLNLGDKTYETLLGRISSVKVGCDFLVCGFDQLDTPHIFSVSSPSEDNPSFVTHYDDPGFAAIGSGGYIADSILYGTGQSFVQGLQDTIYNVCAAKFASESASDVGETTFLKILHPEDKYKNFDITLAGELKKIWEKNKPVIPDKAAALISANLGKFNTKENEKSGR